MFYVLAGLIAILAIYLFLRDRKNINRWKTWLIAVATLNRGGWRWLAAVRSDTFLYRVARPDDDRPTPGGH